MQIYSQLIERKLVKMRRITTIFSLLVKGLRIDWVRYVLYDGRIGNYRAAATNNTIVIAQQRKLEALSNYWKRNLKVWQKFNWIKSQKRIVPMTLCQSYLYLKMVLVTCFTTNTINIFLLSMYFELPYFQTLIDLVNSKISEACFNWLAEKNANHVKILTWHRKWSASGGKQLSFTKGFKG